MEVFSQLWLPPSRWLQLASSWHRFWVDFSLECIVFQLPLQAGGKAWGTCWVHGLPRSKTTGSFVEMRAQHGFVLCLDATHRPGKCSLVISVIFVRNPAAWEINPTVGTKFCLLSPYVHACAGNACEFMKSQSPLQWHGSFSNSTPPKSS